MRKIIAIIFYQLINIFSGACFFKKLGDLKLAEKWDKKKIKLYQEQLLNEVAAVAFEEVDFYKRQNNSELPLGKIRIKDLQHLPVLTKTEVRQNLKSLVNRRCDISRLKKTQSSGSTGEPKIFYYDKSTYGWRLASMYLNWTRAGFRFGQKWMRISLAERKTLFYRIFNFFSRCTYVDLSNFDDKKLKNICQLIEEKEPEMIYSYSSSLYIVSEYLNRHNKHYDFVKTIVTQGDILFPKYRKLIEKVFGTKVYDTYGGDGIVISGQCSEGNYHINDLGVVVEIVDDEYKPVPDGEMGRILVTDLHNHVMPLIRYEIADLGKKKSGKCKCGSNFSMMEQPVGRDTDIIKLSNGINLIVHYFTVLFEYYEEILQFQVREVEQDEILINLKVTDQFRDGLKDEIVDKIIDYSKGGVKVQLNVVDEIPLESSNKRRLVIGRG